MIKNEREQEILNALRSSGYVSVHDLSRSLYISESTVRRTLANLEEKGMIKRSYGGAELLDSYAHVPTFGARAHHNVEAKKEIARKAATLVPDGSIIFLDQSSTAFYLAGELMNKSKLTVMTNNVEILSLLSQTDFTVYSSGGRLSEYNRMCLVDTEAERSFGDIYAEFAFFSAKALTQTGIISDCQREEISVRNAMLRNADMKIFLCDSKKFGTRAAYRQCSLDDLDCLISEGNAAEQYREQFPRLRIL